VLGRAKALDGGVQGDHGGRHGVAGGIGVEAAVNLTTLVQKRSQPERVGAGASGGEAPVSGMEGKATDGVDRRFAKDHWGSVLGGHSETTQVFAGAGGQAAPSPWGGAAKFSADRSLLFGAQKEDGVGSVIGIKAAGVDERGYHAGGQAPLNDQVIAHTCQLAGVRLGEPQFGWGGGREWPWFLWQEATGEVADQPIDGAFEVEAM